MAKDSTETEGKKISFVVTDEVFNDLHFYTASLQKAKTPGPHMRDVAIQESLKGKKLRERLVSKAR